MLKKHSVTNIEPLAGAFERRRQWIDRRRGADRRNDARMRMHGDDCRSGLPRRAADVAGELAEGEVWWRGDPAERQ